MKTIFVSDNPLLDSLYANGTTLDGYKIKRFDEHNCVGEIDRNNFDYALVSPLVYAQIKKTKDYRIIKGRMLVIEDYSGEVTICIANNKRQLKTIHYEVTNEYLIVATKLLLSERFGIELEQINTADAADVIVTNDWAKYENYFTIDLSEDWYDTFEIPMIVGFWIVKEDDYSENSNSEISTFALSDLNDNEIINFTPNDKNDYDRIGFKHWLWNDRFEYALDKTFDMLFYRNIVDNIADIKFAGLNYEE